jgi:hypothetical protein
MVVDWLREGRGRRWTQAATPDRAVRMAGLRGADRPIPHDFADDRISRYTGNETR